MFFQIHVLSHVYLSFHCVIFILRIHLLSETTPVIEKGTVRLLYVDVPIYSAGFRTNESLCMLSCEAPYLGPECLLCGTLP